jgi:putative transposase
MIHQIRKRTEPKDIVYSLHLYFSGLSLRNASKAISRFVQRSHSAIRDWIQKYKPERLFYRRTKISKFIVDETQIKIVGSKYIWLWIAIEPENRKIVGLRISKERNMFVIAERFLSDIVYKHGKYPISTEMEVLGIHHKHVGFWKLNHHIHSFVYKDEKSIIERTMQYIKDITEGFDDYFPCRKKNCKLKHVKQWLNLFAHYYNKEVIS